MSQPVVFFTFNNVQFVETPDIKAIVDGNSPIPVEIAEDISSYHEGLPLAEKVKKLVESSQLWVKTYTTHLSLVKPSLDQVARLDTPCINSFCVGAGGSIYYAHKNTVFKWDPTQQTNTPIGYRAKNLTAITELPNGELLVGDEEGCLHFPDGSKEQLFPISIRNILLLSPTRCILSSYHYKHEKACIVDLETKKVIKQLNSITPLVFKEDFYITDHPLRLWKYEADTNEHILEKDFNIKGTLKGMASKTKAVLVEGRNRTLIVDLETSEQHRFYDQYLEVAAEKKLIKCLEDEETFFHYSGDYPGAPIVRRAFKKEIASKDIVLKGWGVLAFLTLKSTRITLCVTRSSPAHLYLISNENSDIIFDDQTILTNNDNIDDVYELPDASILLRFGSRLVLLRPSFQVEKRYIKRELKEGASLSPKRLKKTPHHSHLFVGEGTFSGVFAFVKKHQENHPGLAKNITATELHRIYGKEEELAPIDDRIAKLQKRGVTVLWGINAEKLHEYFKGKHFERIHWNHPFGDPKEREAFKSVILRFFQSCSQLQIVSDRVYVALDQGDLKIYRQGENPIVQGATEAGYRLIRKRPFGKQRYPGYQHNKTGTTQPFLTGDESREFVFEKVGMVPTGETLIQKALSLKDTHQKEYQVKYSEGQKCYYFDCSTDEESSDNSL